METAKAEAVPMDRLAKVYLKIRLAMQEKKDAYEAEAKELDDQRKLVASAIRAQMQNAGLKSVRTEFGTVILSQKTRYWAQDWDAMKTFIKEHDALDLLEKRIAQTNMAKFLEGNPGVVPPGLNSDSEIVVTVRKPT